MSLPSLILALLVLLLSAATLWLASEMVEGKGSFTLHWGNVLLVTLLGTALFALWGWPGASAVVALFGVWWLGCAVAARLQR